MLALVRSWRRDTATTQIFIEGLRAATAHYRFQITHDAFRLTSLPLPILGDRVGFTQLIKVYGTAEAGRESKVQPVANRRNDAVDRELLERINPILLDMLAA